MEKLERPGALRDMAGRRFGMIVAICRQGSARSGCASWLCRCDCGTEVVIDGRGLRAGRRRSCGCLAKLINVTHGNAIRSGGRKVTPEYVAWTRMWERCTKKTVASFRFYGARGIRVCDRWQDFKAFLADMGPRPSRTHSLDRIDSNGNYEPENCRWATPLTQGSNRRGVHKLKFRGVAMSLTQATIACGLDYQTVRARFVEHGVWALYGYRTRADLGGRHES
jgi:hypothetical protein